MCPGAVALLESCPMLRLLLVRHARTTWNAEGRVQGGGALDELGRAQALALAERLRGEPIDGIYASNTLRARQTAMAVARVHGAKVRQRHLLRDLDYGALSGAFLADFQRESPGLIEQWRDHPETVHFKGGESLADLRRRISRFITELYAHHPSGTVLASTHDSPVRVAASLALGLDDSHHNRPDLITSNASINIFEIAGGEITLRVHNDIDHLKGISDGR
jgi:broad specificity phosphatase PhoE